MSGCGLYSPEGLERLWAAARPAAVGLVASLVARLPSWHRAQLPWPDMHDGHSLLAVLCCTKVWVFQTPIMLNYQHDLVVAIYWYWCSAAAVNLAARVRKGLSSLCSLHSRFVPGSMLLCCCLVVLLLVLSCGLYPAAAAASDICISRGDTAVCVFATPATATCEKPIGRCVLAFHIGHVSATQHFGPFARGHQLSVCHASQFSTEAQFAAELTVQ
jgi:hypothetical protein